MGDFRSKMAKVSLSLLEEKGLEEKMIGKIAYTYIRQGESRFQVINLIIIMNKK